MAYYREVSYNMKDTGKPYPRTETYRFTVDKDQLKTDEHLKDLRRYAREMNKWRKVVEQNPEYIIKHGTHKWARDVFECQGYKWRRGDRYFVMVRGRLGKDNPNAYLYKRGEPKYMWSSQNIDIEDAAYCDVYLQTRCNY